MAKRGTSYRVIYNPLIGDSIMSIQIMIAAGCEQTLNLLAKIEHNAIQQPETTADDVPVSADIQAHNAQIASFHKDLKTTIEKIVPIALFAIFLIYHTAPTLAGAFVGSVLAFYTTNASSEGLKQVIDKIKSMWQNQEFRESVTLVGLSTMAITVAIYPPPVAFTTTCLASMYAFPYIKAILDAPHPASSLPSTPSHPLSED